MVVLGGGAVSYERGAPVGAPAGEGRAENHRGSNATGATPSPLTQQFDG